MPSNSAGQLSTIVVIGPRPSIVAALCFVKSYQAAVEFTSLVILVIEMLDLKHQQDHNMRIT